MKHKDKWQPIVLMILTTLIAMGAFYWIKSWDSTRFLPVMEVAGEETDATIGRLITCVVLFICSLASVIYAERFNKKSPDQLALPWTLATLGGTLLWVSIGECSWHFGFNVVSDEGEILFTNFPRIESIQGIPLMLLTLMAIAAAWKKSILSADVLFFGVYRQLVRPFVHDRAVSDCHGLWNESGTAGVLQGIRTDSYLHICGCRAVSDIEKGDKAGKQIFLCGAALYGTRNTDVRRHDGRNVIFYAEKAGIES